MRHVCFIAVVLSLFPAAVRAADPTSIVQMLVPGFQVEELPIQFSNQNNLRFAPDGTLTSLGYDGKIWRLRDTNGDGLEDTAEPIWDQPTLSVPLGMAWSTHGLFVSSKGKVSLLTDTNGDGRANVEQVIASGWPPTDVGSGGVDATAVTLDPEGNVYFGLLVADYSNAYRLRKRKELKPEEIAWLKQNNRWQEPIGADAAEDQFSLYDLNSPRGTIQKWSPKTKQLTTIATGIRVPVGLAFNRAGDLFNTDQEGETWMPHGNPLDELNLILPGHNYGFPPPHEKWLPGLISDPPVVAYGPQHQSSCGLVFNEPHEAVNTPTTTAEASVALPCLPAQGMFGPPSWSGDAIVAGESRGKIWRTHLVKTPEGFVGIAQTIARLSMLVIDVAISPRGELYVCCHSGPPDWGTGPRGAGKIFKISYRDKSAPIPLAIFPTSPTEVHVSFNQPLALAVVTAATSTNAEIEFGAYVGAGDRFEVLKPPYAVVQQQDATPRGRIAIRAAHLADNDRTLVLNTDPHPLAVHYAVTLPGIKGRDASGPGDTVDLDYDLTQSSQPIPHDVSKLSPKTWNQPLAWAPKAKASAGTDSRAPRKPDGDWQHGRELFYGEQLQCAKCHRIRGEGGLAGPDLSNLIHRDSTSVLRDVRDPNATLHPDYVTYQVTARDGETVQGFIRSQTENSIQLFDADGKETVLARSEITSFRPTDLSLMPAGLLDGRSETDIRDLLTFLLWEPPKHSADSVKSLLAKLAHSDPAANSQTNRELRLVLVASKQDHGPGQHDYPLWQTNWARLLTSPKAKTIAETAWEWPRPEQFATASVMVFYCWNHDWSAARLAQLDAFLARGGGIVLLHAAVIADDNPEELAAHLGLSAQPQRSHYRHMPFELDLMARNHPITQGLPEKISLLDEPYWPLIGDTNKVEILASAQVAGASRPLIWTCEQGKGRVFASIPGHYTRTLADPLFRLILLRGIAWAAGENPARLQSLAIP